MASRELASGLGDMPGVLLQEFNPDVLVGDVAYACALGQSEILRRGEGRGRLPRVMVSALPILDPLVPGRMENMPNNLAYVPQMGTSLSNRMVSQPQFTSAHVSIFTHRARRGANLHASHARLLQCHLRHHEALTKRLQPTGMTQVCGRCAS